jgi:hypothetical protein
MILLQYLIVNNKQLKCDILNYLSKMAAAYPDTTQLDDAYMFAFRGELMHIAREDIIKIPFLKIMITTSLNINYKCGVYHIDYDKDEFKLVYNFILYNKKPGMYDREKFSKAYDYFLCGEELTSDDLIESGYLTEKEITDIKLNVGKGISVKKNIEDIYSQDSVTIENCKVEKVVIEVIKAYLHRDHYDDQTWRSCIKYIALYSCNISSKKLQNSINYKWRKVLSLDTIDGNYRKGLADAKLHRYYSKGISNFLGKERSRDISLDLDDDACWNQYYRMMISDAIFARTEEKIGLVKSNVITLDPLKKESKKTESEIFGLLGMK